MVHAGVRIRELETDNERLKSNILVGEEINKALLAKTHKKDNIIGELKAKTMDMETQIADLKAETATDEETITSLGTVLNKKDCIIIKLKAKDHRAGDAEC